VDFAPLNSVDASQIEKEVGSVVNLTVDGTNVSYTITQSDVTNAGSTPGGGGLAGAVVNGLLAAANGVSSISSNYTVSAGAGNTSINVTANSTQNVNLAATGAVLPPFTPTGPSSSPTFDLAPLDVNPDVQLGVVIQATVDGKAFQYKITQDDIDHANGVGAWDVTKDPSKSTQHLSTTVRDSLVAGMRAQFLGTTFQVSTASSSSLTVSNPNTTQDFSAFVGPERGSLSSIDPSANILTGTSAYQGIALIDQAMQKVNEARSSMGAVVSRLQFAVDNLFNVSAKATESRSRIEDTDYSMATTELAKRNIIQQAAQAMLAQANQQPQMVLQLLK
jgi:flagellin